MPFVTDGGMTYWVDDTPGPSPGDMWQPTQPASNTNNPTGSGGNGTTGFGGRVGGGGGGGGGGATGAAIGNGFYDNDIRVTPDGHIYAFDRTKASKTDGSLGAWVDAGTDPTAAAAQLGIPVALLQDTINKQVRADNTSTQSKIIGVNPDGSYSWVGSDGKVTTGTAAQAGGDGITPGELAQAAQEEAYRNFRAQDAQFQMSANPALGGQTYQQYSEGTQLAQAPLDREAAQYQGSAFGQFPAQSAGVVPAGQVYSPGQNPYTPGSPENPTAPVPAPTPQTAPPPAAPGGTPAPTPNTGASAMSVPPGNPAPAPSALPNPGVPAGNPAPPPTSAASDRTANSYSGGIQNMQAQYNSGLPARTPPVSSGYDASAANGMTHQQAGQYNDDLNTAYNIGNSQFKIANQATDQANQAQQMAVKQNQATQTGQSRTLSGMGYPQQGAQVTGLS